MSTKGPTISLEQIFLFRDLYWSFCAVTWPTEFDLPERFSETKVYDIMERFGIAPAEDVVERGIVDCFCKTRKSQPQLFAEKRVLSQPLIDFLRAHIDDPQPYLDLLKHVFYLAILDCFW